MRVPSHSLLLTTASLPFLAFIMENVYEIISQQFPLALIFESLYPHKFSNRTLIFSLNNSKKEGVIESDTPWSWLYTEDVVMKFNFISQSLTSCPTICALLLQHMASCDAAAGHEFLGRSRCEGDISS